MSIVEGGVMFVFLLSSNWNTLLSRNKILIMFVVHIWKKTNVIAHFIILAQVQIRTHTYTHRETHRETHISVEKTSNRETPLEVYTESIKMDDHWNASLKISEYSSYYMFT